MGMFSALPTDCTGSTILHVSSPVTVVPVIVVAAKCSQATQTYRV